MGKASRTKRERQERERVQATIEAAQRSESRQLPVFWIVIALLVVAGLAAIVVTAPDDADRARDAKAADVPTYADVTVDGADLPTWSGEGDDDAVGRQVPSISGTDFEGMRTTWSNGGVARAYVVVAHWCPHCQAEVPRIAEWAKSNDVPEGVEVVTVSTSADEAQPNFPPAAWLAEEGWEFPVLIDDEVGTAAQALGVEGFPFLVFVDRHGKVQQRFSGEMPIDEWDEAISDLAADAPGAVPSAG